MTGATKPSYSIDAYRENGIKPEKAAYSVPRFPYFKLLKDRLRFRSRYDYYEHFLRAYVRGKSVIDIGAMWLVDGRFSFFAEDCGAAEVTAFDAMQPTPKFLEEVERRKSKVRYVQGDVMDAEAMERLGKFDVVFCCGVLYHLPDPALGLQRLRMITRERALIGTAVISEGLFRNRAVYYPYMDAGSRKRWGFGEGGKHGLDTAYDPALGYINWFWGLSPSCVASLLATTGFILEDIHFRPHFAFFDCRVEG